MRPTAFVRAFLATALTAAALAGATPAAGEPQYDVVGIADASALATTPAPLPWNLADRRVAGSANLAPLRGSGATGAGVTVAVLDTGVTKDAPLLHLLAGHNTYDATTDASDDNGHGTHVAATIAARDDRPGAVAGVAPGATVLPVKVLDRESRGSSASIARGVDIALRSGARVLNLSLGGPHREICEAVAPAVAAGAVVIAASGNDGGEVLYPAACPGVIAVGANRRGGSVAGYSNRGSSLDLVAPGGDTADGDDGEIVQYTVVDGRAGYYFLSGTSMAAPHVAGAAALMLQAAPKLTAAEVAAILTATATDVAPAGRDDASGAGILDIASAVSAARAHVSTPAKADTTAGAPGTRSVVSDPTVSQPLVAKPATAVLAAPAAHRAPVVLTPASKRATAKRARAKRATARGRAKRATRQR